MGNENIKKISINSQKADSEEAPKKIFSAIQGELRDLKARFVKRKK